MSKKDYKAFFSKIFSTSGIYKYTGNFDISLQPKLKISPYIRTGVKFPLLYNNHSQSGTGIYPKKIRQFFK